MPRAARPTHSSATSHDLFQRRRKQAPVDQPAGRRDDDVDAAPERITLRCHPTRPVDLNRQLARRHEEQAAVTR